MEQNTIEEVAGMKVFSNPEDLAASMNTPTEEAAPEVEAAPVAEETLAEAPAPDQGEQTQVVESAPSAEPEATPAMETAKSETDYSESDVEETVFSYLSERLGREVTSFDDFNENQKNTLDERVEAIARFVEETGRSPQDWFAYQSLNPSEMDDVTAVKVDLASTYSNLAPEELDLLLKSKYKVDPDLHTEDEIRLSQIQLKVDAEKARKSIDELRSSYMAPEKSATQSEGESIIDDNWIASMSKEVDALDGLEFNLGGDKSFTFTLDESYKSELKNKNARLNEHFDAYVNKDGSWDYDTLSSHRAVIDNIDTIVSSAYKQGLGDGQRGLVQKAANVQSQSPQDSESTQTNPLADQLKNIMGGQSNKLTFKI